MITQARSFMSFKKTSFDQYQNHFINLIIQKLFLVVLVVVKMEASPFVLIDPSTGRAVEQVPCNSKNVQSSGEEKHLTFKSLLGAVQALESPFPNLANLHSISTGQTNAV